MNVLVLLLAVVMVSFLYLFLLAHVALRHMTIERHFSKRALFEGEHGEMTEIVTNASFLPIVWLRIESSIANALQFTRQTDLELNGDRHIQSLFTLLPRQRIIRRYPVTFRRRGAYSVSSSALTAGDVVGFFQQMKECQCRADILVWPHLLEERDLPPLLLGMLGEWRLHHPLSEDPYLIRGLREYRPGDPIRSIHWPTTAKTGKTHITLHDPSSSANLMVLLNGQKTENQWGNLMDYEQSEIEQAVSLAATVCVYALRHGCSAGFGTNLKLHESEETPLVLPLSGQAQVECLLDTFAMLRIAFTLRFETYLKTLSLRPGTDILILTYYTTDEMNTVVQSLKRQGYRVQVYLMPHRHVETIQ